MSELNAEKIAMNAVKTKRSRGFPEMILVGCKDLDNLL
jgi:hypothetical protein